jgi:entericidin B
MTIRAMKTLPRSLPLLAAILTGTALLAGCSTVEGMGRDIEKGGQVISDTARDVREKL